MGVTAQRRNIYGLENDENDVEVIDILEIQRQVHNVRRRPKKVKKFQPLYVGEPLRQGKNGIRRMRRIENMNDILCLVENEEVGGEITDICELLEPNVSVFAELFAEECKMKVWNDFINLSEDEQRRLLAGEDVLWEIEDEGELETMEKESFEMIEINDKRTGYTADECFKRLDSNLKAALKKKHLPWGMLKNLEEDVTSFFQLWPTSVYISHLNNSFERLLLHAICQYLDLHSQSFDDDRGARYTQVENRNENFVLPMVTLSDYLKK